MENEIEKDDSDYGDECIAFLILSGKLGNTFLDIPKRKRKIAEYAKLMGICIVFDLKRIFLKLCHEGKSKLKQIMEFLKIEGKKFSVVENWIKEAIDNIIDTQLKNIATETWEMKKKLYGEKEFDLAKMFMAP